MGTPKRERQKANRAQKLAEQQAQQVQAQRKRSLAGLAVVVAAVVAIGALLWLTMSDDDSSTASSTTTTSVASSDVTPVEDLVTRPFEYGTTACPPAEGVETPQLNFEAPPENCLDPDKTYTATFDTTAGPLVVDLDTTKTPGTANNFVFLARNQYYDNTKLFRADSSIDIVQGGSPHTQSNSDPGPGYDLQDEGAFNSTATRGEYTYTPGDLVMARSSKVDGASAQFFFVTGNNGAMLDDQGTYVVFGHLAEATKADGLAILQAMVASAAANQTDVPDPEVTINSVTITER